MSGKEPTAGQTPVGFGPRPIGRMLRAALFAVALLALPAAAAQAAQSRAAAVGTARNAIGLLLVNRTSGKIDRLQSEGTLPLFEGDELKMGPGPRPSSSSTTAPASP